MGSVREDPSKWWATFPKGTHRELTEFSQGIHRELTEYSQGTHRVLTEHLEPGEQGR